ncbi:hypothetical protein [Marinicrinis lubricantis]|uniref:Uncharacterized protein n=1 Tax=Marinicrinis lubricantis TaxID=2086470 RepID=A0ABW1IUH8_9BACL
MSIRLKRTFILVVTALVIGYPAYQILTVMDQEEHREDAVLMLYQVSLFQMEMLRGALVDSENARTTSDLEALKQSLYSAGYVHERFRLAVGSGNLGKLDFPERMQQYILRIQIGGERKLEDRELQPFIETSKIYEGMFETYRQLMSSSKEVYRSQNERLQELDQELSNMFQEME